MSRSRQRVSGTSPFLVALSLLVGSSGPCHAQGTAADYSRAESLRERTRGKVSGAAVRAHWLADNARFWYRNDRAGGSHEFVLVDTARASRAPAFDHAKLAEALGRATSGAYQPDRLPIDRIEIDDDGSIRFEADGKAWRYDAEDETVEEGKPLKQEPPMPSRGRRGGGGGRRAGSSPRGEQSPDGKWIAR